MAERVVDSREDLARELATGRSWRWLMGLGVVWLVLGFLALVVPFAATLAIELLLGVLFVVGGIAQLVQAFRSRDWPGSALSILGGALALGAGILLLLFPMEGIATLTLILSAFFVASGVVKVVTALQNRSFAHWGWLLFSGILSLVIGGLIFLGWPASAVWAIGLLVGIELIFTGVSMIMLASSARPVSA